MKTTDFLKKVESGAMMVAGEYRSSQAETISYRDKTTQRAMTMNSLRHTVEVGDVSIAVSERVDDTFQPGTYVSKFKKGQRVILHLKSLTTEKGLTKAQGSLEPLE